MAAVSLSARAMTGPDGAGEQIQSQTVSVRYFDVLGITPSRAEHSWLTTIGRALTRSSSARAVATPVWRRSILIGKRITLDALSFTVIGIAPAGFQIFAPSEAWTILPTSLARGRSGVGHYLRVIGRLRPDATLDGARGDMTAIADAIATERPELNRGRGILLEPLHDGLIGPDLRLTPSSFSASSASCC